MKSDSSSLYYSANMNIPPQHTYSRGTSGFGAAGVGYSSYTSERSFVPTSINMMSMGGTGGARNYYRMIFEQNDEDLT